MNLTHYLSEFLLQDGIIEIPTLGTFRIQYIPSHFDENHHIYSAPKKEIVFTSEEIGNKDIVQFIAEKENVQFNVAQKIWYIYVQALLDKLREEKKYALEGLGSLEVLEDGSYSFSPEKNLMLFGNTFGLEDLMNVQTFVPNPNPQMGIVEPLPVETNVSQKDEEEMEKEEQETKKQEEKAKEEQGNKEKQETEIIKQDKVELIEQVVILEEQQNPDKSENIEEKEEMMEVEEESLEVPESATDNLTAQDDEAENIIITQKKSSRGKRIFIGILLALIILAALFCCYLYYEKYEKNKVEVTQQEQPATKPKVNEIKQFPDSTQHEQDTIKEEAIQENLHEGETLVDGIVFMPDSKQGIDIIAGFFKVKENAIKEAKRMKDMGFDTYVIHRTRGIQEQYYVSIGSFGKQSEAVNFMRTTYKEKKIELMLKKW